MHELQVNHARYSSGQTRVLIISPWSLSGKYFTPMCAWSGHNLALQILLTSLAPQTWFSMWRGRQRCHHYLGYSGYTIWYGQYLFYDCLFHPRYKEYYKTMNSDWLKYFFSCSAKFLITFESLFHLDCQLLCPLSYPYIDLTAASPFGIFCDSSDSNLEILKIDFQKNTKIRHL